MRGRLRRGYLPPALKCGSTSCPGFLHPIFPHSSAAATASSTENLRRKGLPYLGVNIICTHQSHRRRLESFVLGTAGAGRCQPKKPFLSRRKPPGKSPGLKARTSFHEKNPAGKSAAGKVLHFIRMCLYRIMCCDFQMLSCYAAHSNEFSGFQGRNPIRALESPQRETSCTSFECACIRYDIVIGHRYKISYTISIYDV